MFKGRDIPTRLCGPTAARELVSREAPARRFPAAAAALLSRGCRGQQKPRNSRRGPRRPRRDGGAAPPGSARLCPLRQPAPGAQTPFSAKVVGPGQSRGDGQLPMRVAPLRGSAQPCPRRGPRQPRGQVCSLPAVPLALTSAPAEGLCALCSEPPAGIEAQKEQDLSRSKRISVPC